MVKFGVFADLHIDIIHDGQRRLEEFLDVCRREKVDFIVQLGDFCYPDSKVCVCRPEHRPVNIDLALKTECYADKKAITGMFRDFEKPSFHVIGNHDCDLCSKEELLSFYGSELPPYYSFDMGGFHFIVLDANYYRRGNEYVSFDHGNYFDSPYEGGSLPWIPPEEMRWLEEDLRKAQYPSVLFSHQRLVKSCWSVCNAEKLEKVLKSAPKGVLLSLNGHEHLDEAVYQNGIWYYNVNSMSNFWVGEDYAETGKYGSETDEKFPNIRYTIPYHESVFSVVELDEDGARITGVYGHEDGKTAEEMDLKKGKPFYENILRVDVTASSENRYLPFK